MYTNADGLLNKTRFFIILIKYSTPEPSPLDVIAIAEFKPLKFATLQWSCLQHIVTMICRR